MITEEPFLARQNIDHPTPTPTPNGISQKVKKKESEKMDG
jgi:hypothetical protein